MTRLEILNIISYTVEEIDMAILKNREDKIKQILDDN